MSKTFKIIPYSIVAVFVLFALFIGQFVYRSTQSDTNLVSENYYQEEIDFQDRIDKSSNALEVKKSTKIFIKDGILNVRFKEGWKNVTGRAFLYYAADDEQDVKLPFETIDNTLKINTKELKEGFWTLKLDFEHQEKKYYLEKKLRL